MNEFLTLLEELILAFLAYAELFLKLLGDVVIAFGSTITFVWFMQAKLKNPYQPSGVIP
jgi:hypothetical protein